MGGEIGRRLVFDTEKGPEPTPTVDTVKADINNMKADATTTPQAVDKMKSDVLKKLNEIKGLKQGDKDYKDVVQSLETRSVLLKNKIDYIKAKSAVEAKYNKIMDKPEQPKSASDYANMILRVEALDVLKAKQAKALLPEETGVDYEAKISAIKKVNTDYLNEMFAKVEPKVKTLSDLIDKFLAKDTKPTTEDWKKLKAASSDSDLVAGMKDYESAKKKGFAASDYADKAVGSKNKDLGEFYDKARNLYNALLQEKNDQSGTEKDPKKLQDHRDWLAGARDWQRLQSVKAGAWDSWNSILKKVDNKNAAIPNKGAIEAIWAKAANAERRTKTIDGKITADPDFKTAVLEYSNAKAAIDIELGLLDAKTKADADFKSYDTAYNNYKSVLERVKPFAGDLIKEDDAKLGKIKMPDPKDVGSKPAFAAEADKLNTVKTNLEGLEKYLNLIKTTYQGVLTEALSKFKVDHSSGTQTPTLCAQVMHDYMNNPGYLGSVKQSEYLAKSPTMNILDKLGHFTSNQQFSNDAGLENYTVDVSYSAGVPVVKVTSDINKVTVVQATPTSKNS